ncbi:MAG: hypothetical protein AAF654_06515 [Myxococcota bacterium]
MESQPYKGDLTPFEIWRACFEVRLAELLSVIDSSWVSSIRFCDAHGSALLVINGRHTGFCAEDPGGEVDATILVRDGESPMSAPVFRVFGDASVFEKLLGRLREGAPVSMLDLRSQR